jgi:hypothetical protein
MPGTIFFFSVHQFSAVWVLKLFGGSKSLFLSFNFTHSTDIFQFEINQERKKRDEELKVLRLCLLIAPLYTKLNAIK